MASAAKRTETDMVDISVLIGSIRRFGLEGPPYEVLGPAAAADNGQARMMIRLLESGEKVITHLMRS